MLFNNTWTLDSGFLGADTHNLSFFANWESRISSFQAFNWYGSTYWKLCISDGAANIYVARVQPSLNVSYIGSGANDRADRVRIEAANLLLC